MRGDSQSENLCKHRSSNGASVVVGNFIIALSYRILGVKHFACIYVGGHKS
jgi:hypothetical protein